MTRILCCTICLLFYTLTTLVENSESQDRIRPAKLACEKYRTSLSLLNISKIRGYGDEAVRGEFPFLVAVGFLHTQDDSDNGTPKYSRAGVLISEKHVLTTCFAISTFRGKIPIEVLLGSNNPRDPEQPQEVQRLRISRIIWHPEYDRAFEYSNIAILELKAPVKFSTLVQPVCLMTEPLTLSVKGANDLVISTWTFDYWDTEDKPTTIVKVSGQRLVERTECAVSYEKKPRIPKGLADDMICLGKNADSRPPCYGRTSTPVMIGSEEFLLLVGITTFHYRCPSEKPGVAVSIYKHLEWIEREVWPEMVVSQGVL